MKKIEVADDELVADAPEEKTELKTKQRIKPKKRKIIHLEHHLMRIIICLILGVVLIPVAGLPASGAEGLSANELHLQLFIFSLPLSIFAACALKFIFWDTWKIIKNKTLTDIYDYEYKNKLAIFVLAPIFAFFIAFIWQ